MSENTICKSDKISIFCNSYFNKSLSNSVNILKELTGAYQIFLSLDIFNAISTTFETRFER